jgi:hypothetical protein
MFLRTLNLVVIVCWVSFCDMLKWPKRKAKSESADSDVATTIHYTQALRVA